MELKSYLHVAIKPLADLGLGVKVGCPGMLAGKSEVHVL
jgi:hypothetical protein